MVLTTEIHQIIDEMQWVGLECRVYDKSDGQKILKERFCADNSETIQSFVDRAHIYLSKYNTL